MYIVILAVVLSVVQTSPPIPRQTTNSAAPRSQNRQENAKSAQAPTTAPVPAIAEKKSIGDQTNGGKQGNEDTDHPITIGKLPTVTVNTPRRDWADWGSWAFNLILVGIGGAGIYWAIRTVNATEKAAKAALLNAQAVIYTERPWLIVEQSDIKRVIEKLNFVPRSYCTTLRKTIMKQAM
jgi:hypothetical protein